MEKGDKIEEDTFIQDKCVDNLFDISIEFEDSEEKEDFTYSDKELPSDIEDSDEDNDIEWSDFDLLKNNNEFEGSSRSNIFRKDIQNVENFANLFINDLFEFISMEMNRYYIQNSNRNKQVI